MHRAHRADRRRRGSPISPEALARSSRGPIGGWFVGGRQEAWILLVAGDRAAVDGDAATADIDGQCGVSACLLGAQSRRRYYTKELAHLERDCDWLQVAVVYTRPGRRPPGPAASGAVISQCLGGRPTTLRVYVCGPTGFVESVTTKLIGQDIGLRPSGPSGLGRAADRGRRNDDRNDVRRR
jgi:NAD(P)H-flavin reductase